MQANDTINQANYYPDVVESFFFYLLHARKRTDIFNNRKNRKITHAKKLKVQKSVSNTRKKINNSRIQKIYVQKLKNAD